jgi:IclR family pca regulon transcriptional regulator
VSENTKNVVQSAAKVFAVLRAFDVQQPELTITDIAGRTGLDRGTSFRLIHTLVSLGYLAAVPGTRRFRLTLQCLELGYTALAQGGLRAQAAPLLRELVPDYADAASLGVLEGADVVYVERAQGPLGLREMDRRIGSRAGAYATALGQVILAWQAPGQAQAVLESAERVRLSERTLVDIDALMERLAAVRRAGYALSDGENAYGLRTMAAPVMGPDDLPVAAVSLTVRSQRQTMEAFQAAALPALLRTAAALTKAVRLTHGAAPALLAG